MQNAAAAAANGRPLLRPDGGPGVAPPRADDAAASPVPTGAAAG